MTFSSFIPLLQACFVGLAGALAALSSLSAGTVYRGKGWCPISIWHLADQCDRSMCLLA